MSPDIMPHSCCAERKAGPLDNEGCFTHCAIQKLAVFRTEHYLQEEKRVKTLLISSGKSIHCPESAVPVLAPRQDHYLDQSIKRLDISRIYFIAAFNHAPPAPQI
jgi:hypothetical protein